MIDLKIPPPVIACILAGLMYLTQPLLSETVSLVLDYKLLVSLFIAAMALLLDFFALWRFIQAKTTVNPIKANNVSALVTTGVYRFSRNPMYVGNALFLLAWMVYLANPLNSLFIVAYVMYTTKFQIIPEERILTEHFGDDYSAFCQRVRRWL